MKSKTITVLSVLFAVVLFGLVIVFRTSEESRLLEKTIEKMSNSEIVARASFSEKLSLLEIEKIRTLNWKLTALVLAEAKGRAEFLVVSAELQEVCLTVLARRPELTLRFNKDCGNLLVNRK